MAADLKADIDEELSAAAHVTWFNICDDPVNRRKLFAGVGMATAQQMTGIDGVQYYLLTIFTQAGITSTSDQFGCLVLVGVVKVLAIVVAGYLFDRFGRRPLLQASSIGLAASLVLLAIVRAQVPAVGLLAVTAYVASFSAGMGPGAWLIPTEVFSNDIRAKGISLSTFGNRLMSLTFSSSFLSMQAGMTPAGSFCFFAAVCLCITLFITKFVPETKGKTLEDVHRLFER